MPVGIYPHKKGRQNSRWNRIKQICKNCKKIFWDCPSNHRKYCSKKCWYKSNYRWKLFSKIGKIKKGHIPWNKGKKGLYSKAYREKLSKAKWKGGKIKSNGYIRIYQPNHPFAFTCGKGYVLEHRLEMEKRLGRYLKRTEVVHHINGNPSDNRIENLMLFPNKSIHQKFHHPKGKSF